MAAARRRITAYVAILLLLVACSAPEGPSRGPSSVVPFASQPDPVATEPGASQGGAAGGLATVEITVHNGPRAGRYTDEPSEEGCLRNLTGAGTFDVKSGPMIDLPDLGLEGYLVVFLDAASAGSGTDNFQFLAYFYGDDHSLNVIPVATGGTFGTGTATLDDRGDTASISVEATTEDGIEVSAIIECHSVRDS